MNEQPVAFRLPGPDWHYYENGEVMPILKVHGGLGYFLAPEFLRKDWREAVETGLKFSQAWFNVYIYLYIYE